jgi:hypothetical protein
MNVTRVIVTAAALLALDACGRFRDGADRRHGRHVCAGRSKRPLRAGKRLRGLRLVRRHLERRLMLHPTPAPDTGTTDGSPFTCSIVVDSDGSTSPFKVVADGSSLTTQDAIAYLEALTIADEVNLSAGNVNSTGPILSASFPGRRGASLRPAPGRHALLYGRGGRRDRVDADGRREVKLGHHVPGRVRGHEDVQAGPADVQVGPVRHLDGQHADPQGQHHGSVPADRVIAGDAAGVAVPSGEFLQPLRQVGGGDDLIA